MKSYIFPFLLSASFGFAQEKAADKTIVELDALTIESSPLATQVTESTHAWSVLTGNELEKAKGTTIAETLSNIPGVSQSHFGPTANRPIIRGMDKFRVRMLQNGTDTFDVSAQSEDHAVPVDPIFVDRIEILRGSSALLHGGSAIGGVLNVIDRSIPSSPYDSPGASVHSNYNSVNDGWNYGAMAFGSSDKLSFQINGFKRDYNDYDTPSFFTEDHHTNIIEGPFEVVKNSHGKNSSIGFGGSYMLDSGFAGLSFSRYNNDYGVPGEHAESDTLIEMENDRFEFRSEIEITDSDWLTGVELNIGYGDYKHSESGYETENNVTDWHTHSTYLREGFEGRVVLRHEIGELNGVIGFHGHLDEFSIVGEESIFGGASGTNSAISSEESKKLGIFLIEEFQLNEKTKVDSGIRFDHIERDFVGVSDRDDSALSASVGFNHILSELWSLGGNLNYSERIPDSAELFSDGAHHATESFEIGNSALGKETARGIEVILRRTSGTLTGQLTGFYTKFNDYIFLEETGVERDSDGNTPPAAGKEELPEKVYEAAKAKFYGLEIEVDWLAIENPGWALLLSVYGDTLRATNESEGTNLPRIAPARLGLGFEVQQEKLDYGMRFTRSMKQDKVSVHSGHSEEPTAAYSLLNAFASYDVNFGDFVGELFVKGNNLTDELAYNHASVLKQFSPLPGRSVEIGLKFDF
jgi:iron complex outermembrane receptor protein